MFSISVSFVLVMRTTCPSMMEEHVTSTLREVPVVTEAQV